MSNYGVDQACGLYRCFDNELRLLYAGVSLNVAARNAQHGNKPWMTEVSDIKVEWFQNGKRALTAERRAIRFENPKYNKRSKNSARSQLEDFDYHPPSRTELISIWTCLKTAAKVNVMTSELGPDQISSMTALRYFDVLAILNQLCDAALIERKRHSTGYVTYKICNQNFEPVRDLSLIWQIGDLLPCLNSKH